MSDARYWDDEIDDEDDEQRLYWESTNDDLELEDMTDDDWKEWLEVVGK